MFFVLHCLFAPSSCPPALQGLAGAPQEVGRSQAETSGMDRESDLEGGMEMDLDSYQVTLEEVLTWLLSAEDMLQIQDEVSDDVEEVKDQFHTHEVLQLQFCRAVKSCKKWALQNMKIIDEYTWLAHLAESKSNHPGFTVKWNAVDLHFRLLYT